MYYHTVLLMYNAELWAPNAHRDNYKVVILLVPPLALTYCFCPSSFLNIYQVSQKVALSPKTLWNIFVYRCRRSWHATHDCVAAVAPYVDIILHRGRF